MRSCRFWSPRGRRRAARVDWTMGSTCPSRTCRPAVFRSRRPTRTTRLRLRSAMALALDLCLAMDLCLCLDLCLAMDLDLVKPRTQRPLTRVVDDHPTPHPSSFPRRSGRRSRTAGANPAFPSTEWYRRMERSKTKSKPPVHKTRRHTNCPYGIKINSPARLKMMRLRRWPRVCSRRAWTPAWTPTMHRVTRWVNARRSSRWVGVDVTRIPTVKGPAARSTNEIPG